VSDAEECPDTELWQTDLSSGERTLLCRDSDLAGGSEGAATRPRLEGYQWSPDGASLLLARGGTAWLHVLASRETRIIAEVIDGDVVPRFSPDGRRCAFVRAGNLLVLEAEGRKELSLSRDGSSEMLNGKLDWVYWEELGHRESWNAFRWSPDSRYIAWLRLDQRRVPCYPHTDLRQRHPQVTSQRYPRAGDPNSVPALLVAEADTGQVRLQLTLPDDSHYLPPTFRWAADARSLYYVVLTRDQRRLELRRVTLSGNDPASETDVRTAGERVVEEVDPHWLNLIGPPELIPAELGGGLLWLSERSGFAQIYRSGPAKGRLAAITHGSRAVESIRGVEDGWVYFVASGEDPRETQYCRVPLAGGETEQITNGPGIHSVRRAPSGGWALVTEAKPERPPVTRLYRDQEIVTPIVHGPRTDWTTQLWARTEGVTLRAESGEPLYGQLTLPVDFDPARVYPAVVHVYGGPHAQQVRSTWTGAATLDQLLAAAGVVVWRLDNRGSARRGHAFEVPLARRLGRIELQDQLVGLDYLSALPYVDAARIGITGWSYGGYLTLYALAHASDRWRCGVAGAPVTDWGLYDSIYTERYMGTPAENPDGYKRSSVIAAAAGIRAPVLLIHGADDDNVHPQHTLQLLAELATQRVPYRLLLQPGEKHSFRDPRAKLYVNEQIVAFFREHLAP
jgi:dipeptidyl-peptidase-4